VNRNFIVKVIDAKLVDLQKALQAAGIKVRSIVEVFREGEQLHAEEKEETK